MHKHRLKPVPRRGGSECLDLGWGAAVREVWGRVREGVPKEVTPG